MAFAVGQEVLVFVNTPILGAVTKVESGGTYVVEVDGTAATYAEDELYALPLDKRRMTPKRSAHFFWMVEVQLHGADYHLLAECYARGGGRIRT